MTERTMNIAVKFLHSLYRFESYPLFLKGGAGSAILYLLVLALVFGTISYGAVVRSINTSIIELRGEFEKKSPEFEFINGEMKLKSGKPFVLEDATDRSVFIIDTTGKTTKNVLDKYSKGALITRTHVHYKKNLVQTTDYDLNSLKGISFNKSDVMRIFGYRWILVPVLYFFYIFSYWITGKLITALLLALAGMIIASFMKMSVRFESALTVAIYSMTASIIIDTIIDVAAATIPHYWLLYSAVAVCYMVFAYRAIKKSGTTVQA